MLNSPFHYETWLTEAEFQKLGELTLKWSHIDHIIGNCLKAMLKFSDEEAVTMVFSLPAERRLQKIKELAKFKRLNKDARAAIDALVDVMGTIQNARNNVIHAIMVEDSQDGLLFHLRSKRRSMTKNQVFSAEFEDLINYAAHAAFSLRHALPGKGARARRHPLPEKPAVPDFLHCPIPSGIRVGPPLEPRQ